MFIISLVAAILLGYIFKGKIKNLENLQLRGIMLIFGAFAIELLTILLIKNKLIAIGTVTYTFDVVMYFILFIFVFINRRYIFVLIMGLGFLLNSAAIFLNGGTMPVSLNAAKSAGLTQNVGTEGLYTLISDSTKLRLLGDIIPINFIGHFVISIGDILISIGLMLFIIIGMKKTRPKGN